MRALIVLLTAMQLSVIATAQTTSQTDTWQATLARARGQTVYWNAWGGDARINDYIAWAGSEVEARYGVGVEHVKISDTGAVVARVLAEKAAGRDQDGSVDLVWINGENFAAMKRNGLLYGPWTERLPNYALVDVDGKPTVAIDFTIPVDGLEAPWGMAQLVFMYDSAASALAAPPASIAALLDWARANPGRFAYPQPPDYLGSTFLKQALLELAADPARLAQPAPAEPAEFDAITAPLWTYLDTLHPLLWRSGRAFPANGPAARRALGDGELDIALAFDPAEASAAIAAGELPDTVRTFVLANGTIGNTHFLAIPFNARAKAGAQVLVNFLLSPEAQARKQDPQYWGDFTVLDLDTLTPPQQALFNAIEFGAATLTPQQLGRPLPEPHPSWMERLEQRWLARYAGSN